MSIHQVQNGFSNHICIGNKLYFVYAKSENFNTKLKTHTTCHMNQLPISDYMDTQNTRDQFTTHMKGIIGSI